MTVYVIPAAACVFVFEIKLELTRIIKCPPAPLPSMAEPLGDTPPPTIRDTAAFQAPVLAMASALVLCKHHRNPLGHRRTFCKEPCRRGARQRLKKTKGRKEEKTGKESKKKREPTALSSTELCRRNL